MTQHSLRAGLAAAALTALAGCTTVPQAQDPVLIKLTELETRLARIERVMDNQSMVELVSQVGQLQTETRELRGLVEEAGFRIETTETGQRTRYNDLSERIDQLERGTSGRRASATGDQGRVAVADPAGRGDSVTAAGSDKERYQSAFELLKEGQYESSGSAFQQFLGTFPDSALADNAQYWYAETFFASRKFSDALPEFQKVLDNYPESRKIPDAWLKIGYCNYELRRWDEARAALTRVAQDYPETTAARLANTRLDRMRSENR